MARRLLLPIFLVAATAAAAAAGPGDATPTPALRGTTASDLAAKDCARARAHHKPCVLTFGTGDTINGTGRPARARSSTCRSSAGSTA